MADRKYVFLFGNWLYNYSKTDYQIFFFLYSINCFIFYFTNYLKKYICVNDQ